jgi:hypothetical protein
MVSWAPIAKGVKTSGNATNEARKKKLNFFVKIAQTCFLNVPPYWYIGLMEYWSNGVPENRNSGFNSSLKFIKVVLNFSHFSSLFTLDTSLLLLQRSNTPVTRLCGKGDYSLCN